MKFNSRRSPVYGTRGVVATSQPLAAEAGMRILQSGGNAADAAVATAAALNVTEPTSTGIGGDCFAIFYNNKSKTIHGVNGSGRAPKNLNIDKVHRDGLKELPPHHPHTITVPGAAAGWIDTIERHGSMEMVDVLKPAIQLAEDGFPVSPLTARSWARSASLLARQGPYGGEMLRNGAAPATGEIMKIPTLANTFRELVEHGKDGFYRGRIAQSIVEIIQNSGGVMELSDLEQHESTYDDPISVNYKGIDVYEIPPNGQGITALLALNIIEELDIHRVTHRSPDYYHLLIEAMRLAFADSRHYVSDPTFSHIPLEGLLSKEYARRRSQLFNKEAANIDVKYGTPMTGSNTVYLSVVDGEGNACSFINSNYMGFGTGIIPKECGFTLQNRGHNFSLDPNHPNRLEPKKRPYHTIIPGMATKDGELYSSFGVMGGFMQPQGHVQVLLNMIEFDMNPQEALDEPRFCITNGFSDGLVALEEGIPIDTMSALGTLGHEIVPRSGMSRQIFGRGQIINRDPISHVLTAGSDARADGMAIGW